jgi:hypothetical protein
VNWPAESWKLPTTRNAIGRNMKAMENRKNGRTPTHAKVGRRRPAGFAVAVTAVALGCRVYLTSAPTTESHCVVMSSFATFS